MKTLIVLALVSLAAAQIQVQIPIQRPQQPPHHQFPQFPQFPQQPQRPVAPRDDWRQGVPDPRCPTPDDHTGWAVLLPGTTPNTFSICWGGIAWPFTCPGTSVFRTEVNACADPGWNPPAARWPVRPFNDEEDQE